MTIRRDAAWLAQHEAKMAGLSGVSLKPPPLLIQFEIPHAMRLPNVSNGKHWSAGVAYRKMLLGLVEPAVKAWAGHHPIERARVTITRYSVGTPDIDGAWGSVKPLVDLLLGKSKTHPHSLGVIRDDSQDHIALAVFVEKVAHRDQQKTSVRIEAIT
jgi:hypothetical protein